MRTNLNVYDIRPLKKADPPRALRQRYDVTSVASLRLQCGNIFYPIQTSANKFLNGGNYEIACLFNYFNK